MHGVPQNNKEAVRWYRMAAEQGTYTHSIIWVGAMQKGKASPETTFVHIYG